MSTGTFIGLILLVFAIAAVLGLLGLYGHPYLVNVI